MSENRFQSDPRLALGMAEAFFDLARPMVDRLGGLTREDAGTFTNRNLGHVVASATNLVFAVELLLKTILILRSISPPRHHRLIELWTELPEDDRDEIRRRFDMEPVGGDEPAGGVEIWRTGAPDRDESEFLGLGIEDVLRRSSEQFREWRYLYEAGGQPRILFEFARLNTLAETLRTFARGRAAQVDQLPPS